MNARSSRQHSDSQWSGSPRGFFLERIRNQVIQFARQTIGFNLHVPRVGLEFLEPFFHLGEFRDW